MARALITAPRKGWAMVAAVVASLMVIAAGCGGNPSGSDRVAGSPGIILEGFETDLAAQPVVEQKRQLAEMHSDGAQWIKLTIDWAGHEPRSGTFNWYLTPMIKEVEAAGMHVEAVITDAPGWAGPAGGQPPSVAALSTFVTAAARTYGAIGLSDFEVLNEENAPQPWGEAYSPQQYTRLLCAADHAIHGVRPHANVITGGFAPAADAPGGASYEPYTYLAALYSDGARGCFDAIADHAYSYPDLPDQTDAAWNPFAYLPELHRIMVRHGDGRKSIWLTEVGAPVAGVAGAVDPDQQAETITEDFAYARRTPWIGPVMVADWRDSVYDHPRLPFGLLDQSGRPRPALFAFQRAARAGR